LVQEFTVAQAATWLDWKCVLRYKLGLSEFLSLNS